MLASYTFLLTQVNANNVQTITSTGDTIQGTLRHEVAYPPGTSSSQQVQAPRFTTKRPTWANDNLFQKLQANGVTVSANPEGTPLWEDLLLRFGPALLFGALSPAPARPCWPGRSRARRTCRSSRSRRRSSSR